MGTCASSEDRHRYIVGKIRTKNQTGNANLKD